MAYQQVPPLGGVYPPAQFTYPAGQQPATVYPPPQPAGHQQTTVIVQQAPKVVVQPVVKSQPNDFFSSLGHGVNNMTNDLIAVDRAVFKHVGNAAKGLFKADMAITKSILKADMELTKSIIGDDKKEKKESKPSSSASAATIFNPVDLLKPGCVVQIISKVCGKSLRVLENGSVDCAGESGSACEFTVVMAAQGGSAIRLCNVGQPHFYLGIMNGYLIGHGRGGTECVFLPMITPDSHITFESLTAPGSHIGVLPSGQITSPAQTNKFTDASHFRIKPLVSNVACIV